MSDFFGIGQAVKGCVNIYFRCSRRTGRTASMISTLNDGDRVYFATNKEARFFENKARQLGKNIECIAIPVGDPGKVFERGTCQGRSVFDHHWIEQYYLGQIDQVENDIKQFEEHTSGWGEKHEQTRLKCKELARWRVHNKEG